MMQQYSVAASASTPPNPVVTSQPGPSGVTDNSPFSNPGPSVANSSNSGDVPQQGDDAASKSANGKVAPVLTETNGVDAEENATVTSEEEVRRRR